MLPVVRTLPKTRLLPSLLDRLTDDGSINYSMQQQKDRIKNAENALTKLAANKQAAQAPEVMEQRQQLKKELDEAKAQFSFLSASVSSFQEIRACVKRDLDWLLNANQYSPQHELVNYPDVGSSVVNFGMPDFTGKTVSGFDPMQIERLLKQVIINYEPRIIRRTLSVKVLADKAMYDHNALVFEIEGELWAEPQPIHLHLRTEFQLEDGYVSVSDFRPVMN
jgi:type VI secretion system protein ImpF